MQAFFLAALKLWSVMSHYYTLYSPSVFSLAKSLQLILEIGTTYRLVSYLLADNWLICRLRTQCMMSNININLGSLRRCVCYYFRQNDHYLDYCGYHKPHPIIVYNQRFRIVIGESPQVRMRWDRRRNKNHIHVLYSTPSARDAIVFAWMYKLKCICREGQKRFEYTRCGGIIF